MNKDGEIINEQVQVSLYVGTRIRLSCYMMIGTPRQKVACTFTEELILVLKKVNDELCEIDGVHVEAMPVQV